MDRYWGHIYAGLSLTHRSTGQGAVDIPHARDSHWKSGQRAVNHTAVGVSLDAEALVCPCAAITDVCMYVCMYDLVRLVRQPVCHGVVSKQETDKEQNMRWSQTCDCLSGG